MSNKEIVIKAVENGYTAELRFPNKFFACESFGSLLRTLDEILNGTQRQCPACEECAERMAKYDVECDVRPTAGRGGDDDR